MEKKTFTQKEAEQASIGYFGGDELAARVWSTKYALKDSFGNLYELTPDDMHHRLAGEIARIESKYANPMSEAELFELLRDFKYLVPAGSPMTGIGNDFQVPKFEHTANDGRSNGCQKTPVNHDIQYRKGYGASSNELVPWQN